MAERSIFQTFLLLVIALGVVVGFYLTIGAVDVWRLRDEALRRELEAIALEVRGLRADMQRPRADAGGDLIVAELKALRAQLAEGGRVADAKELEALLAEVRAMREAAPAAGTSGGTAPRFANADLRDPEAVDGDGIVMAQVSETGNLNYIINNESQVSDYWSLTFDSLAERSMKEPTRFDPMLAERWEISDDHLTYTIHLRKGVLWHDFTDPETGERFQDVEVTADDFKFYIDTIRNPGIQCEPIRVYYQDLEDLRVVDRYTFQVIWKAPYFLSTELTLGLQPLPRHFYRYDPAKPEEFNENVARNRMIVGCGPWVFERWDKGKEIVFRRNEKYYGPKPHLRRLRFKVIKESNARLLALQNGEVDRIGLLAQQWVEQTNSEEFLRRFAKFQYTARVYYYVGYNLRRPPFDDRRVRLALTHCIDRPRILREVYKDLGRIVTGPFFIESPYYDASIEPYPFDIAKAKALLAEAGWRDSDGDGILDKDGKKFEFTFLAIAGSENQARIAAILKEDLAKAGLVMNIVEVEWSVYTERLEEWNFDVCSLGWAMGYESDPYQIWHSSQADLKGASNHVGFKSEEADRIIEAARREFDLDRRIALYRQFHRLVHEEQPYTFLVSPYNLVAQDRRYRNAKVYPLGMHINSFWVPLAEQKYRE